MLWFSFISQNSKVQYDSYCKQVAALRAWSATNGQNQIPQLHYNITKDKTPFSSFMPGLKRSLDRTPPKKAQAFTEDMLGQIISNIFNKPSPSRFMDLRDVLIFYLSLGFTLGLRATDLAVLNIESVSIQLFSVDLVLIDGKTTHDQGERYTCI